MEEISYKLPTPSFDRHFLLVPHFLLSIYINMTLMRQSRLLFTYQSPQLYVLSYVWDVEMHL